MPMVIRPAGEADLDALLDLVGHAGPGLTSLPVCRTTLGERLSLSAASFAGRVARTEAWYTLAMEEVATGALAGVASVRAAVGTRRPHYSFRVATLAQHSAAARVRFDHQALMLVNECDGWSEVGSLFVHPAHRGGGTGALLARARYLLIAAAPDLFADTVMAELRGWFGPDGHNPFWDGVSRHFFRMSFADADRLVASGDGQFLIDLLPRHPIYVELIEAAARDAIGRVHPDGEAALAMLRREGFAWPRLIDVFDGGPTVTCARDSIATVRDTRRLPLTIGAVAEGAPALLSNGLLDGFRATRAAVAIRDGKAHIAADTAAALHLAPGQDVAVCTARSMT